MLGWGRGRGRGIATQVIYLTTHETSLRNMWPFCMPQPEDVPHSTGTGTGWGEKTETKIDILTCGLYRAVLQDFSPINYKWLHRNRDRAGSKAIRKVSFKYKRYPPRNWKPEVRQKQPRNRTVRATCAVVVVAVVVGCTIFNGLTADTECTLEIQSWSSFSCKSRSRVPGPWSRDPVLWSRVSQVMRTHWCMHPAPPSCTTISHLSTRRLACWGKLSWLGATAIFLFLALHFNNWMGQWLAAIRARPSFVWHVRHKVSVWAIAYPGQTRGVCALFCGAGSASAYICLNCIECLRCFPLQILDKTNSELGSGLAS